jgi:DNA mismatch endonuclease (patch repair protein)
MSRIRSKNTKPEVTVRSLLCKIGYSYSLATRGLPATPDVILSRYRTAIQVHGCYWHRHAERDRRCPITYTPKSGKEGRGFWLQKFRENVLRDARAEHKLRRAGWSVITVWQCQLRRPASVAARLDRLLRARAKKLGVRPPDGRHVRAEIRSLDR